MTPLSVRHGLRGLAAQFLALSAVFLLLQVLIQANNDAAQAGPLDPRRKRIAVSSSVDLEAIASRLPSLSEGALAATRRFRAGSAAVRGDAETVVVVMSTSNNRRQRNFIRTSWSSRKLQEELNMQVVFLLGRSPKWSKKGASLIRAEMDRYNDIVEADFLDGYRNLTLKTLSLLHYVVSSSSSSGSLKMVMKVDDDVVIDMLGLHRLLRDHLGGEGEGVAGYENAFLCKLNPNKTIDRKGTTKWNISYEEWPNVVVGPELYPPYCGGPAYIFPVQVAARILAVLEARSPRPFFWLEDVFVTGLLSGLAGVSHHDLLSGHFLSDPPREGQVPVERPLVVHLNDKTPVAAQTVDRMREAWRKMPHAAGDGAL